MKYCPEGWEIFSKTFARGCPQCKERRKAQEAARASIEDKGESLLVSSLGDYVIRRGEDGTLDIRHRVTGEVAQWA